VGGLTQFVDPTVMPIRDLATILLVRGLKVIVKGPYSSSWTLWVCVVATASNQFNPLPVLYVENLKTLEVF